MAREENAVHLPLLKEEVEVVEEELGGSKISPRTVKWYEAMDSFDLQQQSQQSTFDNDDDDEDEATRKPTRDMMDGSFSSYYGSFDADGHNCHANTLMVYRNRADLRKAVKEARTKHRSGKELWAKVRTMVLDGTFLIQYTSDERVDPLFKATKTTPRNSLTIALSSSADAEDANGSSHGIASGGAGGAGGVGGVGNVMRNFVKHVSSFGVIKRKQQKLSNDDNDDDDDDDDDDVWLRDEENGKILSNPQQQEQEQDPNQTSSAGAASSVVCNKSKQRPWERNWEDMALPYEFTVLECLGIILAHLALGVVAFSFVLEDWRIVDSLYFCIVTTTTVGYGDLSPSTHMGRLFTSLYALTGVGILGVALGVLGSKFVEAEVQAIDNISTKHVTSLFGVGATEELEDNDNNDGPKTSSPLSKNKGGPSSKDDTGLTRANRDDTHDGLQQELWLWWKLFGKLFLRYTPALIPLLLGSFLMAHFEGWSWSDAIYYCVVTTCTIGYGDYVPQMDFMKWFAVLFIPLAVGAMGHLLGTVANFVVERRREAYQKWLWSRDWTLDDLDAMDWNGNGVVTELEYMEFMLLAMKKVDRDLLMELHRQFKELDVTNSNTLVKADLELLAKKRMKRTRNKLALSSYKYKLTHLDSGNLNCNSQKAISPTQK